MTIRNMIEKEYPLLEEFLYNAIFVPEDTEKPPRDIIKNADLQVYIEDFGKREDDLCLVAERDSKVIGACWVRIMNDYGHIDDETPSLAISVLEEHRGHGIGTTLLQFMLPVLKAKGYDRVSLAVQKANYAVRMYKKVGFEIVDENEQEYIMICNLQ